MAFSKKQYRRSVAISKVLSAIGMVTMILWVGYTIFWSKDKVEEERHENKTPAGHSISMVDSLFEGSDQNGKDYQIASKSVLKTGADLYSLDTIVGRYDLGQVALDMKARTGEMDEAKKLLKLIDDVVVEYSGYLLKTSQMDVDLTKMSAKNNNEVSILYHHSNIRADKFEADSDANIVHFEGHVLTHFKLSDF